jgi:hypothetical protein
VRWFKDEDEQKHSTWFGLIESIRLNLSLKLGFCEVTMATIKYTNEEEKIIAQVGQTWSRSFLTGSSVMSTSIAVTKTHLFAVGKKDCLQGYQSLDVDLVNISSISFTKSTSWVKIFAAIFFGFLILLMLLIMLPMFLLGELNSEAAAGGMLKLIILLPIVIWCAISAISRVISINVQGVTYNYKIGSTSDDTAQMFVRKVRQLAEARRKEEKQGIVGVAPVDTAKEVTMTKEVTITKEKINLLKSLYEEGLITKEELLAKAEEQLKAL